MADKKTATAVAISRRSLLLGVAAGAGTLALGAGGLAPAAPAATFVKGADISWMPQMRDALRGYVNNALNTLKSAGVTPGWVKIGNETNSGICKPVGSISNPSQMTGLLNAAYDVSKQVFPTTPVMVHIAQPQKWDSIQNFLNAYKNNGGRWDITGLKGFGGLGCFFWEPEGYPSFSGYQSSAWDQNTRRPTAAMDGFLNV